MDENINSNELYESRNSIKRSFNWISFEDNSMNSISNENQNINERKQTQTLSWIPLDNNWTPNDSTRDSKVDNRSERKKAMKTFDWVPLGENFINVSNDNTSNDFTFSVPQRLPPKLKKKLTPLKVTPARRSSLGSSSLRRTTFLVTPKCKSSLKFNSLTTVKKRRSGSGLSSTPRNKSSLDLRDVSTPSSASKTFVIFNQEEIGYISWLNVMLAPKLDVENMKIDSNRLIIECFDTSKACPTICPTKEEISVETYRETVKLNQLRSAANALYRSEDMMKINLKIKSDIEKDRFAIRKDRAIHADIGIKKHIMELLLSYNPLWLRIGLETVYNQTIILTTNRALSLTKFIAQNLLISKELAAKYGHKTITCFYKDQNHENEAKKYILTKFLLLLNFLDRAKQVRLIQHNPCLFRIDASYKSTRELIISFARDYITGVGDITKYLRVSGFSFAYKQMPIEEFDLSVSNLSIDLRCGIRLTRLAELMFERNDLLPKLLFPADNITRKLHNMEIALNAFRDILPEGIVCKDIVNGHRKKTFNLLNAIIFKHKTDLILKEEEMIGHYVLDIQRKFRANKAMKVERQRFLKLKESVILIQRKFRENRQMKCDRTRYQLLLKNILYIQRKFRAIKAMKRDLQEYESLKKSVITVQRRFRANRSIKLEKQSFQRLKTNVILIQRKFRANKEMRVQRNFYQSLLKSVVFIQNKFRANRIMKMEREKYHLLERSVVIIQQRFRAFLAMKVERSHYQTIKSSVILLQRRFRANKEMKYQRFTYQLLLKNTLFIQRKFRANKQMKLKRNDYQMLRTSVIFIQRKFRAFLAMKVEKEKYQLILKSAIVFQRRFRANKEMKYQRFTYQLLLKNTLFIQRKFRALKCMEIEREKYESLKNAVINIQRRFRANCCMKVEKENYQKLKSSSILIQRRFRANEAMKRRFNEYQLLKKSVISVQRRFRANKAMEIEKQNFHRLKTNVILIQRKFRANKAMRIQRNFYQSLQKSVIFTQNKFRANKLMKIETQKYCSLKESVIIIQQRFRAILAMKVERSHYQTIKSSVILIQRRFRANKEMKYQRFTYQLLLKNTLFIQRKFRALKYMEIERENYVSLKNAVINIQRRFRANNSMKVEKEKYQKLKSLTILIQRSFRANKAMREQRLYYQSLRTSTQLIQAKFRTNKQMKLKRNDYQNLRTCVIFIQRKFRAFLAMKVEKEKYQLILKSVIIIQTKFRQKRRRFAFKSAVELLMNRRKKAAILLQAVWRGYKTRKNIHKENEKVKKAFTRITTTTSLATKDMQLGNRTFNALQKLLSYTSLLHLTYELESLDTTTKWSSESCVTLTTNGVIDILIQILNESNRSEPHKKIIIFSISILLNLAKYEKTLPELVSNSKIIELLFKLIKAFNKIQNEIIIKCCTLLWILMKTETITQNILSDKYKCNIIKQILEPLKKEKTHQKRKVKLDLKFCPNWQISRSNVYEFSERSLAIQAIAQKMNINY